MGINISATAKYNPFTSEEFSKPFKGYIADYKAQENDLMNALTDAAALVPYLDSFSDEDAQLKQKVISYINNLNNLSTDFSKGSNNRATKDRANQLKLDYHSSVRPIIDALLARTKAQGEEEALYQKGIITGKGSVGHTSISDYVGGKTPETASTLSVSQVSSDAQNIASRYTQSMRKEYGPLMDKVFEEYTGYTSNQGISSVDVIESYLEDTPLNEGYQSIIDMSRDTSAKKLGYETWEDFEDDKPKEAYLLDANIRQGAITGLQYQSSVTTNVERSDKDTNNGARKGYIILGNGHEVPKNYRQHILPIVETSITRSSNHIGPIINNKESDILTTYKELLANGRLDKEQNVHILVGEHPVAKIDINGNLVPTEYGFTMNQSDAYKDKDPFDYIDALLASSGGLKVWSPTASSTSYRTELEIRYTDKNGKPQTVYIDDIIVPKKQQKKPTSVVDIFTKQAQAQTPKNNG